MNLLLPRFLKLAYRKEPISSFILIIGAVDAVMGGVGQHWGLLSLGTITVLLAVLIRWSKIQQAKTVLSQQPARRYLPPSASTTPLPMLVNDKQRF